MTATLVLVAACGGDSGLDAAPPAFTEDFEVIAGTWARVPDDEGIFGGTGNQAMWSVTAGGPGLVAVGFDRSGDDSSAAVWTSSDGLVWSRVPHDEAVFGGTDWQEMNSVVAGGSGLVAVGADGSGGDWDAAVWTSPDGFNWSRVAHDEAAFGGLHVQRMESVTVGGPGLVAVGYDGAADEEDAAVWYWTPDE